MSNINAKTVTQNGTPHPSKTKVCRTFTTIYNRNEAPIIREIIKKKEPVL
jgi:hypothetical protein